MFNLTAYFASNVYYTSFVEFIVNCSENNVVLNSRIKWYKSTESTSYGVCTINVYVNNSLAYTRIDDGTMVGVMEIPLENLNRNDVVKFEVINAIASDYRAGTLTVAACLEYTESPKVLIKANQDPKYKENYYATFYSGSCAYEVPDGAKAYKGIVEGDLLKMTDIGSIIPKGEPVILKVVGNGTDSSIDLTLLPSASKEAKSKDNMLKGTDTEMTLGPNDYALSLGHHGVGFYLWNGSIIGANKAYLTLSLMSHVNAFTFEFDDGTTTRISQPVIREGDTPAYNLNGIRVNDDDNGVVIKNGKKTYKR